MTLAKHTKPGDFLPETDGASDEVLPRPVGAKVLATGKPLSEKATPTVDSVDVKLISRGRLIGLRGKDDVIAPNERFSITGIARSEIDRLLALDAVYAPNEGDRIFVPSNVPQILKSL